MQVVRKGALSPPAVAELLGVIGEFRAALKQANPGQEGMSGRRVNRIKRAGDGFEAVPPVPEGQRSSGVAWVADRMPRGQNCAYTSFYGTRGADPAFDRGASFAPSPAGPARELLLLCHLTVWLLAQSSTTPRSTAWSLRCLESRPTRKCLSRMWPSTMPTPQSGSTS